MLNLVDLKVKLNGVQRGGEIARQHDNQTAVQFLGNAQTGIIIKSFHSSGISIIQLRI